MSVDGDAVAQAELVREGGASPSELVQAAIDRIEDADGAVNAVVHRRFGAARREAEGALPAGPFRGVPLLVKDAVCHTAGDPYHVGMRLLAERGWVEPDDTELATRFRRAGFVIVGRTNTPELATAYTTEPVLYGPTRNPWDLSRSAGGSSGGSAAAVAAGMVAVAHGNDMGGVHPRPGRLLRGGRPEADPGAYLARAGLRRVLGHADPRGRADADRARHGRRPRRRRRPGTR